jgi:D-amino-acid dehydrogenase
MAGKDILVLGAGMVGVCTAIALRQRGHAVCLVDRQAPGRETSFGNAGIIQREAVWPYAMPRSPLVLAGALLGRRVDARVRLTDLPGLLSPLWRYWQAGHPSAYPAACRAHASLIAHCLSEHEVLIQASQASDLIRRTGYLSIYRTHQALDAAARTADQMNAELGAPHRRLDGPALRAAEAGLRPLAGAIHWPEPWCCTDPGALVQRYARLFAQLGGQQRVADAMSLAPTAQGWQVSGPDGPVQAEAVVVALGPWSAALTRRLGYRLPLFAKRGYHQHFASPAALARPVLDAEVGYVLAPMRQGTRLTTGAELAGLDAPSNLAQLRGAARAAQDVFDLGPALPEAPWRGARPCTADMKPVVGAAPRHPGLWFHFGHGHQGFSLGPVTARLLADLISSEAPFVDPTPFRAERFD